MSKTESFRVQHKEIGDLVGQIEQLLIPEALYDPAKANEVRSILAALSGKLSIHLAMEDKALYPQMLDSGNAEAKAMAESYMKEMGALAEAFKGYATKWNSGAAIKTDPDAFCTETKGVFDLLKQRVVREESHLYPLRDTI